MKHLLFVGHSHLKCLAHAAEAMAEPHGTASFLFVRDEAFRKPGAPAEPPHKPANIDAARFGEAFARLLPGVDAVVMCFNGNEHNNVGMIKRRDSVLNVHGIVARLRGATLDRTPAWHAFLAALAPADLPFLMLAPPPPIEDGTHLAASKAHLVDMTELEIVEPVLRLRFYEAQMNALADVAGRIGAPLLALPDSIRNAAGFLLPDCMSHDPTHGNAVYGQRVLEHVFATLHHAPAAPAPAPGVPARHPYAALPDHAFWRQAMTDAGTAGVHPMPAGPWRIGADDQVAAAGSCFAQHIARRLREEGFAFLDVEPGPAGDRGEFSARYGNVYTARQLVQLFDRAFGFFRPHERAWERPDGRFCDPFRPRIEPAGFATREEVVQASQQHLAAVRTLFRSLDVFVFTLGLTECWLSRLDGAAYPVAPGVAAGELDPRRHEFVNFGVAEVAADLELFVRKLQLVNPRARMILTVSPVPLVATFEPRHVLVASTYSKSVLRVAAEEVCRRHPHLAYFPAYEIVTGPHAGGRYFEPDLRTVTAAGLAHVMRVFMDGMTEAAPPSLADALLEHLEALGEIACDEEMLARP
jgi:hypothetical protein